ncbi:MAG: rhodanese-like domain-containing protein [Cyanobacteria bacterium SID2]|nr:rhodanese-like domain-containing protein [Cyanobacteria bacterium SID2]
MGGWIFPSLATPIDPPTALTEEAVDRWLAAIPNDYYTIKNVKQLKQFIETRSPVLIDVREPAEYQRGHLPGAANVPLRNLADRRDLIPVDRPVVLYCTTGYRTALGVAALTLLGYDNVSGFVPSFQGWKTAGEPIEISSPLEAFF